MGALSSKPDLKRQATIRKRNQHQDVHKIRSKVKDLIKIINKTNMDYTLHYQTLLNYKIKLSKVTEDLHPAVARIYNDTNELIEQWLQFLKLKMTTNQSTRRLDESYQNNNINFTQSNQAPKAKETSADAEKSDDDYDYDEVEEQSVGESSIQAEIHAHSRASTIMAPVTSIVSSFFQRQNSTPLEPIRQNPIDDISEIKVKIEDVEGEINSFGGVRGDAVYVKLVNQLEQCRKELEGVKVPNEEVQLEYDQVLRYIQSCYSFLDEKAKPLHVDPMMKVTKTTMI